MFKRLGPLAGSIGLLALACTAAAPLEAPPATSDGQPRLGGIVNSRLTNDPSDWDISYGKEAVIMSGRTLDSLLGWKSGPGVGYNEFIMRPELAERWEVSPDARTFTYYLHKGVKWANLPPVNGRDLTSADIKWSFEYWARAGELKDKKLPEGQFAFVFEGMEGIDTPDPHTVVVRFKEPYVPFLNYSAMDYIPAVPREIYEQDGHFKDRVIGTGPFQFDMSATQKGTRWVWKKNANYREPGKPYLDEVRELILPDDSTAYAAFLTGRVDLLTNEIPVRDGQELLQKDPNATGVQYVEMAAREMYMNPRKPPLNDVRVRRAINMGIDREEFIRVRTDGKGAWALAGGLITTFTQDEIKKMIPYDPEGAKRLLGEAGFPNGVEAQFEYAYDRGDDERTEAELLQAQLKKIGVNLVLKTYPYAEFTNLKRKQEHSMNTIRRSYGGDIDYSLYRIFHPKSRNAYDALDDPKLVQMLEAQRREPDPAKREQLVREAIRYINVDAAVGRALLHLANYQVWKKRVVNFFPQKGNVAHDLTNSWLEQ